MNRKSTGGEWTCHEGPMALESSVIELNTFGVPNVNLLGLEMNFFKEGLQVF